MRLRLAEEDTAMSHEYRVYRSFEEFEREELRRLESMSASVDEMIDTLFGEELDFDGAAAGRRSARAADEDE
jgi:hypothetical protein